MIGAATSHGIRRDRLVIADVALLYGERSGGIRTYLDEKARFAAVTGAFEHHVIVPAKRERHRGGRHEVRALRLVASNGYRLPLGVGAVKGTLRQHRPRTDGVGEHREQRGGGQRDPGDPPLGCGATTQAECPAPDACK